MPPRIGDAIAPVDVTLGRLADYKFIGSSSPPAPFAGTLIDFPGIPVAVLACRHLVLLWLHAGGRYDDNGVQSTNRPQPGGVVV